ncbi:MAG: hypothetical protein QGG64_23795, partial [Candidatus Latescibacteria bacterium]|nr:hypothetical protein [Candidatus Latescibacterota bacterium]
WPESRYFEFIRAYQAHIDKRCGTWTQAENLQAMVSATSFFLAMAAKIDPPKGRPRRMKPSPSGRIFDHMTLPNSKLDIENDLDSLVKEYLRLEKSLKIGVFAGKESFAEGGTDSLEEAIAYIDADMDDEYMADIQKIRMPPGKQLELFIDLGGTPERFNAFKMRLYRTKEKHRTNQ